MKSKYNEIKIRNKSYKIINDKFNYYHTVKRYDNWYKIAKYYNVKLSQVLDWNNAQKIQNFMLEIK